jgi:hypothetical protein
MIRELKNRLENKEQWWRNHIPYFNALEIYISSYIHQQKDKHNRLME